MRAADTSKLEPTLDKLASQIMDLSSDLQKFSLGFRDVEGQVPRARLVLEEGRTTLGRGREANALIRSAGVRLYDAVEGIRAQVNIALLSNEPDIAQLVSGLSKTMPAYAQSITGPEFAVPPAKGTGQADLQDDVQQVMEKANRVEATSREVESIIASIGATPTAAQVEACGINAAESGLNFRLDPTTIVIDTSADDPTGVAIASGGKSPYHARWTNQPPGSDVTLQPVDHDSGARNQGIITIKAAQTAPAGTYRIDVTDDGNGHGKLLVTVWSPGGQRSGGGSAGGGAGTPGDPALIAIQNTLIDPLKCLAATDAGGKSNADGKMGLVAEAALKKLMVAGGELESDYDLVFKVNGQFNASSAQTYVDDAKEDGTKCVSAAPPAPEPGPTP